MTPSDFVSRADLDDIMQALEKRFDGVERQIRGLRNWGAVAFLILLAVLVYVAWRVGV